MARKSPWMSLAIAGCLLVPRLSLAADHNDPNAVNSIFSDVNVSAADLYDMFGWPSDDKAGGEKVILALTFASIPQAGVLDSDMLYRIRLDPDPRPTPPSKEDESLEAIVKYAGALADKYVKLKAAEVRVTVDKDQKAHVTFLGFPKGGDFSQVISTNTVETIKTPDGQSIQAYVGGRDDAFFNDLPGFFRSINYAPQFYHVPHTVPEDRELKIPKTLLELEGNKLFNFDPQNPQLGQGKKEDLPGDLAWSGDKFYKDANGNFRFVYSGKDAQAGRNINAIILEIPLSYITTEPKKDRVVNTWGESWVLKAANKIITEPDNRGGSRWSWFDRFHRKSQAEAELEKYKLIDTDGVPFEDAALSERRDSDQLGANNAKLARQFVIRFGHLGWGFGPSVSALGLGTCFDHDNSPVSKVVFYKTAVAAFPRVKKCFFQRLNMPDDAWRKNGVNVPLKRTFEIFLPNVNAIDMDTTGTWPYGRRPEDQVATRFLATFLDMKAGCGGKPCNLETLGDQALWDHAPIEPKTPPNPLKNDKPFLDHFPYLADPWPPRTAATESSDPVLAATKEAFRVYRHASLTADFSDFRAAETAIDQAIGTIGPSEDLYLLKANFDFKLHRLARTKDDLEKTPDLASDPRVLALRADLAFQEGRYGEARQGYEVALRKQRTWDNLARLAYLKSRTGDVAGADALYVEAEDLILAKDMRSYAWVELQRGLLHFEAGRPQKALEHYERADRADPGSWQIEEHIAEVLHLLGRTDESVALYRKVIDQTHNPEYVSALAAILRRDDLYAEADRLFHDQMALYPEAALGHYIRSMIARRQPSPDLLAMAQQNVALRPNGDAKLLLAQAYLKLNEPAKARAVIDEILATPWRTPELSKVSRQVRAAGRS
jgi:tetratricopeptide (TPR) repeat protein